MRLIARKTLRTFWDRYPDSQSSLQAWCADVKQAIWHTPTDITAVYRTAGILPNNRVVFNLKGNPYRLVVAINYAYGLVYIRFVGTHRDCDQIDTTSI